MIRAALVFFLIIVFFPSILSGQNSPFSNGKWVKIAATKQGVYQITGTQLKAMGFTIPFTSSQVQLYNYNLTNLTEKVESNPLVGITENSILVNDGGDNQFDEKDFLLFYSFWPDFSARFSFSFFFWPDFSGSFVSPFPWAGKVHAA